MIANRPAVLGGFVLGGLILAVAAVILVGGMNLFTTTTRAVVFFQSSVAGLQLGAPVTFRGVRVGSVQSIALRLNESDLTASIPVFIELEAGRVSISDGASSGRSGLLVRLIDAGLRAQLTSQSLLTGQLAVDLDLEPNMPAHLAGADMGVPEIPTLPSEFQKIKEQLSDLPLRDLVERAARTLRTVETLGDSLNKELGPTLESFRATSDAARVTLSTTNQAIGALQTNAGRTLQNVDQLLADGQKQLAVNGADLDRALVSANRAIHQAEILMNSVNNLTESRSQMRADLAAALRDLAASASSLRSFTSEVERNPSAILTGRGGR
jgi:paraquat-inducible protein B